MNKLMLLAAGGVGHVLGARAGRERYDELAAGFNKVRNNPTVQEKTQQATDYAAAKAPVVKEKVAEASSAAAGKVGDTVSSATSGSSPSEDTDQLNPDRLKLGEDTGPQGDLP